MCEQLAQGCTRRRGGRDLNPRTVDGAPMSQPGHRAIHSNTSTSISNTSVLRPLMRRIDASAGKNLGFFLQKKVFRF